MSDTFGELRELITGLSPVVTGVLIPTDESPSRSHLTGT